MRSQRCVAACPACIAALAFPAQAQSSKQQANPAGAAASEGDVAYGAYQRGHYLTAFNEARKRVEETGDPKAMALLAELYANGLGVPKDDAKAVEWYKRAADKGDREASSSSASSVSAGAAGRAIWTKRRSCSPRRRSSAIPRRPTTSACLYVEGQALPQDLPRAAELFRTAAQAGSPEAQYALATLYARAAAWKKIRAKPRAGSPLPPPAAISMPKSNMPLRCSTAAAWPRTKRRGASFPEVGAARKSDFAEPPRAYSVSRARLAGRSGHGRQVAHGGRRLQAMATSCSTTLLPS